MVPTMPPALVKARREKAEREEYEEKRVEYDNTLKVWDEDQVDRATMTYDGEEMRDLAIKGSLPVKVEPRQIAGYDYYTSVTGIPVVEKTLDIAGRDSAHSIPQEVYWPISIPNDEYTGVTYWDTVAGEQRLLKPMFPEIEYRGSFGEHVDPPSTPFDADAILEEVRQFIDWLDVHDLSVKQRLEQYREQRPPQATPEPDRSDDLRHETHFPLVDDTE